MKCKYCGKEFVQIKNSNFCSKSCAAKFNTTKSKEISAKKKQQNIEKYNQNPKKCKHCNKSLPYEKRHLIFCNSSCAASYNNSYKEKKSKKLCINCGKEVHFTKSIYCSTKCQQDYLFKKRVEEVDRTGKFPLANCKLFEVKEVNRKFARRYLEYKFGHKCSICGNTHWLGKPILLIVDHIDGDIENYNIDNYRLVCSNCDATLPTYKNKNRKNGKRKYRRVKQIIDK